ncbi:MAG: NAD-dependent epimerase/dehydratase family protein [Myxococcota bacterium]
MNATHQPGVIAVTGLCTFLGRGLVSRLLECDPDIRIVGLDYRRPQRLDDRVRFARIDLTDPIAGSRIAEVLDREGAEALVHMAFRTNPTDDIEADHELETIGSLHVLNACSAANVRRVVLASSTMLYGPRPDNPNFLTEEHPLRGHPDAHSVKDRVEVEGLFANWAARYPANEVTVLRSCWVVGPHFSNRVTRYLSLPVVPKLFGYDPLMQFVHEEDCLDAFERATLESHPGVYNVAGRGVLPFSTLLRLAGKRILSLPPRLLYRMAYYPAQSQTGDAPAAFYDYLRHLWVADAARGWDAFGEPCYSTKEAWISFVSALRMRRYR